MEVCLNLVLPNEIIDLLSGMLFLVDLEKLFGKDFATHVTFLEQISIPLIIQTNRRGSFPNLLWQNYQGTFSKHDNTSSHALKLANKLKYQPLNLYWKKK